MYDPDYKVIRFLKTPLCTDDETYEGWRAAARQSRPGEAGFCQDCTPEYQQSMIELERCEHPWVKFKVYSEPEKAIRTKDAHPVDDYWNRTFAKLSDRGIAGYIPASIKNAAKPVRRFRF